MKPKLQLLLAIILILVFSGFLSCHKDTINTVDYIIVVDSIAHQDTILTDENLVITFFGVIGPNGCYAFKKFDVNYENDSLIIIPWGSHTDQNNCTEILPLLNGKELIVSGLTNGTKSINIVQADSIPIVSKVVVN